MGERLDPVRCLERGKDRLHIDAGMRQQRFTQRLAWCKRRLVGIGKALHLDETADQRIAIRMRSGRSEAKDDIAWSHIEARQDLLTLNRAHREAREIIIAAMINAGHLGGLTANERAVCL